jgi:hypothetical protein
MCDSAVSLLSSDRPDLSFCQILQKHETAYSAASALRIGDLRSGAAPEHADSIAQYAMRNRDISFSGLSVSRNVILKQKRSLWTFRISTRSALNTEGCLGPPSPVTRKHSGGSALAACIDP